MDRRHDVDPSSGEFAPRRIAVVGDGPMADDVARRLRESAAGQVVRVSPPDPASGEPTGVDRVAESTDATAVATSAVAGTDPADQAGFLDRWAAAPGSAAVVGVFETTARERAFVAAARAVTPTCPSPSRPDAGPASPTAPSASRRPCPATACSGPRWTGRACSPSTP
ncbi:hypothetical protein ACFQH6_00410 [Halobacteriaceae archaeon GCM10025711]